MAKTIYIIDGHSQIYRAYYAPFRPLTSPTGEPTRATYVFCSMMLKFFQDRRPEYIAFAADSAADKLKRKAIYPDYKITRKPGPEDLPPQIARIMQIVQAMGIPILQIEGYEADDIIATAVDKFSKGQDAGPCDIVIVSRDKDLDQLLGESTSGQAGGHHVVMYDPLEDKTIDAAYILATKGYPADKAVEVQTLMGDATDNIPGIEGVGPKTAAQLVTKYGTVENIVAHADQLPPKLRERILAGSQILKTSRQLVTLDRDVPIPLELEQFKWAGLDGAKIRPLFAELGFNRLLEQLDKIGIGGENVVAHADLAAAAGHTTAKDFEYACIDTIEGLENLGQQLQGVKRLAVDTETTCVNPMWCQLVGISLAWQPGKAFYLPVKGPLGAIVLELDDVRRVLGPIFADRSVQKIGQNLKYDILALAQGKIEIAGPIFDTMVAAHVLDSTRASYKLDTLAAEFLGHHSIPIGDLIGRGKKQITMDAVPCGIVSTYACEDADVTFRLAEVLETKLREEKLFDLFNDLEMPLLPVLADMEMRGIAVDPKALRSMQSVLAAKAETLRAQIIEQAGVPFNPDSPKQLADILFDRLNLPRQRQSTNGPSTDSDVLESLAALHPLPALVLEYRKLQKLIGTYCQSLIGCIHPCTGRIHTSFHQAGTATGRLSSSDPNLQNIPIRTEEGRQIRSAFIADEGFVLLSADYSQIELRVLAHLCQDPKLMQAFADDQDIHNIVAAEVFAVPLDEVTPEMRSRAKTVNFGIIYGQTAFGLAQTLRIGRREAGEFIATYRARFPRIDEFLASCVASARKQGYVETIFRRRRRVSEIDSRNPARRNLAERLAINSVVQGSAADLIKQAMVNIDRRLRLEKRPSRMLLQIHDELLFEVPVLAVEPEKEMIVHEMSHAMKLSVPLKVEVGLGKNWMEAK